MLKPYYSLSRVEAGCDEVGRGCLAGPVLAAAVVLPKDYAHPLLNDSKRLSPEQRSKISRSVQATAIDWAVGAASPAEIDQINILQASWLAMHRAIAALRHPPELLLIDGPRFRSHPRIPHVCIVRGDAQLCAIAAASVLAKVHRDAYMRILAAQYPGYAWENNVGYPTRAHRHALMQLGLTPHHRRSYVPVRDAIR